MNLNIQFYSIIKLDNQDIINKINISQIQIILKNLNLFLIKKVFKIDKFFDEKTIKEIKLDLNRIKQNLKIFL